MADIEKQAAESDADLRAEVSRLRAVFADTVSVIPPEWKLTTTEERLFRVLLAVEHATPAAFTEGAGSQNNSTVRVHIGRIRAKVKRFGVEIETVQSKGWRLVGRFTWARALAPS